VIIVCMTVARGKLRVRRYGAGVVKLASGESMAVTFPDGQTRTFISRYLRPTISGR
jgi:ATP-dependent DNA helicase RecQ